MAQANRLAAEFLREQMQMDGIKSSELSAIFHEEPPALETFMYDQKYLNHLRPTLPTVDDVGYPFKLGDIQLGFLRSFEQIFQPELYIAMVEEFGPQWTPLPMKNMYAIEWGKGSLAPETPIYNARTGQWIKLRDFKADTVASAYAEDGKVFKAEGTDAFKEGDGMMYNVTTQSGRVTKVWEGHRFLAWGRETYSGGGKVPFDKSGIPTWKRLWNLKVGDHIAVSSTLPEPTELVSIPDWEVEWVGMMIGDGCVSKSSKGYYNHNLTIGYQSPIQKAHCLQLIEDRGLKVRVVDDGRKFTLFPTHGMGSRGKFHPMRDLMDRYKLSGHKAATKHIPKEFFSLSTRQVALLVSRLIDTDGWVSISNTGEVGYGTVSEQLAEDLIHLLLRLGVVGEKKVKNTTYNGELYTSYQVRVRKQGELLKLLPQLSLLDKEKKRVKLLEWLNSKSGTKLQAMHGDMVWDKIVSIEPLGVGEYWTLSVDGPASYISAGGILDHNSGKDTVVRLGFTRIASLLSHMKTPQGYFNMPSSDAIHMLNVATTAPQARRAFFDPMKKLFKTNRHMSEFFYGDDPAEGANQIRLKNDIYIISGNSMAESQEGLNLIAGVADEISAFKVAEEFRDKPGLRTAKGAEGIVNFLQTSSSSRFPTTYKVAQISFPRFANDAIEKAVALGNKSIKEEGDKSIWFVSGPHATWEVKPGLTKESFKAQYDADPETADAMLACKPPKSSNAFIRDETAINSAFSEVRADPVQVEYYWGLPPTQGDSPGNMKVKPGWQVRFTFSDDLKPVDGALYCLHGDMAIRGDRAGIAMSHVQSYRSESEEDERPVVKNDFVFTFESDLTDKEFPREVQIRWYRQLIWELIDRGFEIDKVTFDQFQSTDMMQTLNMYGIDSGLLSLDRNDKVYQTLKDIILDGRLVGYREYEALDPLVVQELKRLRKVGRKVDHLPGQSKDAADALGGSVFNAIMAGGEEDVQSDNPDDGGLTAMEIAMHFGSNTSEGVARGGMPQAGLFNPSGSNPFLPNNRY